MSLHTRKFPNGADYLLYSKKTRAIILLLTYFVFRRIFAGTETLGIAELL